MTDESRTALVIGATGGIGGAVARKLIARGWDVRGLARDPASAAARATLDRLTWVAGDAMDAASVVRAAEGASLIFHGANPPGYRNWAGTVVQMLDSTIVAARQHGARIVFPGTVYNYGPDAGAVIAESAPQNPMTRKGVLRAEMERRLKRSGVPTLIVRAGDYFGPGAANSWLSQGLLTPGKPLRSIRYPGPRDIGHAWAYLPDVAETFARLIDRRNGPASFETYHFGGHYLRPGIEMAEAIRRVAGRNLPIHAMAWWALRLIAPFNETLREMMEMRYLWQRPLKLDNAKLISALGAEPHTPLDDAVRAALSSLGFLADLAAPSPGAVLTA